jgi:hypothetical protein
VGIGIFKAFKKGELEFNIDIAFKCSLNSLFSSIEGHSKINQLYDKQA